MHCIFDKSQNREAIKISPGEYFVSTKGMLIHTLLGSCASVLLYDPVLKAGGMNHFMVSDIQEGSDGIKIMEALLEGFLRIGSKKNDLEAKLLGGSVFSKRDEVFANNNIHFAETFLKNENIKIINRDTGGNKIRKIYYYPSDFKIFIKKIAYQDAVFEKQMTKYKGRLFAGVSAKKNSNCIFNLLKTTG